MRYLNPGEHFTPGQAQYVDLMLTAETKYLILTGNGRQGGKTFIRNAVMKMLREAETFGGGQ